MLLHLLLLLSATSALKVRLIDGNEEKNVEIECDKNENVNIVREKLISNRFIGTTSETQDWRILKDNHPIEVYSEQYIHVGSLLASGDNRLIFSNMKKKVNSLNIKIGENAIRTIKINWNEKLSKVREHLNENGLLGSQTDRCVKWKFLIRDREYVTDESQLTIAQHLDNSKKDQLQITDVYSQDIYIELYVYAGLKSLLLPKISLAMNLFDLHSVLSGAGTCNGKKYDFLDNDWLALKKTADLASLRLSNPDLQISPDLIFTPGEANVSTIRNAYFRSRNGRYGVEYVSKTSRKRNIIGEVVAKYSRSHSPKVSLQVEKNTYCPEKCNEGVILDPVMLDNVQSTSTAVVFTSRVVLCQKGTALRFTIDTEPRTPFWITVKHDISNQVFINTRGDHGQQSYWSHGYNNIVADSHVITKEEDLLGDGFMPTYVVEVYELLKTNNRRRRDNHVGDIITVPDGSTNAGKLTPEGRAHTGPGTDEGFGPGRLLMEIRFMLLTFKDAETAQEIMGRGVSRHQTDLL